MKRIVTLLIAVLFAGGLVMSQTIVDVVDDGSGTGTVTWTKDNIYLLDGFVFVNSGQTLTIEAGTVIKAKPGTAENASALIVASGGKIIAEGTADEPIIFTAQADDLAGAVDLKAKGLWGGLILLGDAATNQTGLTSVEGIPTTEPRGKYGSTTPENANNAHDAGILTYVSIRHGGTDIGEANEINGLTLGAVGTGTTISYVEVLSNKDDGIEFFGGVPRVDHALIAYVGDDSFDYDQGYQGYGQFWLTIQDDADSDRCGEHDGGDDNELGRPFAHPVIANATYIGSGINGNRLITFRDHAGGEYHHSIFTNTSKGIDIEFIAEGTEDDSHSRFEADSLIIANNIFYNIADGAAASMINIEAEETVTDPIPAGAEAAVDAYFTSAGNMVVDPQVTEAHPSPKSTVVWGEVLDVLAIDRDMDEDSEVNESWFSPVAYKGAMEPGKNWADWTEALKAFTPDPLPAGEELIVDNGNGIDNGATVVNWTANNTYILDGFVFVNAGQTLNIQAGTVIKGKPGQAENASALIVAKGGMINVQGTADEPVIFTSLLDDLEGSVDEKARGLWGGVIILGNGSYNQTGETAVEGIPTSETRGLYGSDTPVEDDNNAQITYMSIRHGGTDIGEGNEINGLTLGACGTGTSISNVEVLANKDDGVEFFGGAPRLDHILVAYCADDSYDYDMGYHGYGQFWVAIQDPADADRCGEHDGGDDNELGRPFAHPVIANATYIGSGISGKRMITFRDNAGGEYHHSIFTNQNKGIDMEYLGDATNDDSHSRFLADSLILANNIFYGIADDAVASMLNVSAPDGTTVPAGAEDALTAYFTSAGNEIVDPGVTLAHPAPKTVAVWGEVLDVLAIDREMDEDSEVNDSWFSPVAYKGAFEPGKNWADWTEALKAFTPDPLPAGELLVVDNGNGIDNGATVVNWTANNTYILDGFVFVNAGQTLNIQAGTVIKGKPGQAENASALIVAKGGMINVQGTADEPVIFTSLLDDLEGSVDEKARGLWGGVIILGNGSYNQTGSTAVEGIPTSEPRGLYGSDTPVEDDNNAQITYMSIRHGGTDIGEGNEINGLTLGACGTGTSISYVEVLANKDDGVEFFGGAPKLHHILVAYCADDSYDYDMGYHGYGQFWVAIQDPADADRCGEHDGGDDNELGRPFAHPVIANATYIGSGISGKRMITFRDNAGGEYHHSIFTNQNKGIDMEYLGDATNDDSHSRFLADSLILANNIFYGIADDEIASMLNVSAPDGTTVPAGAEDALTAYFTSAGNEIVDPGVTMAHPAPKNVVVWGDVLDVLAIDREMDEDSEVNESWFSPVAYKGAFEPGKNWADWTEALKAFTPDPLPAGELLVVDNGNGIDDGATVVNWTANNTYILDGFVFVNAGQTLNIQAGTVIKGKPGQAENASALIVAKGGMINVQGTATDPVIFTSLLDDLEGSVDEKARGLWGGVIILGNGSYNQTGETAVEGIPTSEPRGLYGSDTPVEDDNNAQITYMSIRHGGTDIGEGNEINGLTLGACGTGTSISYVEVLANKDDGVEFFGGAPRLDHILVAYCADDSYDYDMGYHGYGQYWVAIQDPADADRCGEHDGGDDNELGRPFAHPIIMNATYVGSGISGKRMITFRDNAGGEYHQSIFVNQDKGIDIEYLGDAEDDDSHSRYLDDSLKIVNSIFYSIADDATASMLSISAPEGTTVPAGAEDALDASFTAWGNTIADPGVVTANPTPTGDVNFDGTKAALPDWFETTNFIGAFKPEVNWAADWTEVLGTVTANNNQYYVDAIDDLFGKKDAQTSVEIYPNPITVSAQVNFEAEAGKVYTFNVYSLTGKRVRTVSDIRNGSFTLNKENLNGGLYVYELRDQYNQVQATGKVMIAR